VGIDAIHHESRNRAWRVVFARIAGALQVVEDLFVYVAEMLSLGQVVEVDLADLVDHLSQELAGLHVVVGVLKNVANDTAAISMLARYSEFLKLWEELRIDEAEELVSGWQERMTVLMVQPATRRIPVLMAHVGSRVKMARESAS
jgi:hypothetical protein